MDEPVQAVIDRLTEAAGRHDATQANRLDRWRVLEPDAGRLLWFLVQARRARSIVTAQHDAREIVQEAGLADHVEFRLEDGRDGLTAIGTGEVDLLFLDAERTEYASWWPHPVRVVRQGGVLVADNALSHAEEIAPLQALLDQDWSPRSTWAKANSSG